MDCNMDEAIRTKEIAMKKLQLNDFAGARKLALKAQQLYPNLDNINQLLSVCAVHCASQQKIYGNEMDWYGILQITQTADDSFIKKRYRKLALLLHPDKNKFPGAEAAFKLIGEAQRFLLDLAKRQLHDMRRVYVKPSVVNAQRQQTKNNYNWRQYADARKYHHGAQNANNNFHHRPQPPAQSANSAVDTFVTACPYCTAMRQVCVVNRNSFVLCHSCKKLYIASKVLPEKPSKEKNDGKAPFVKKDVPTQGPSSISMKVEGNTHTKNLNMKGTAEADCRKDDTRNNIYTKSKKVSSKRKRSKLEEFSEDSDSDNSFSSGECVYAADGKLEKDPSNESDGDSIRRKSIRQKQKISYNESLSDDELLNYNDIDGSVPERKNQGANVRNDENGRDQKDFESPSHVSPVGCNKTQKLKIRESPAADLKDLKSSSGNFKPTAETKDVSSKETRRAAGTGENLSGNQFEDSKSSNSNESLKTPDPEFFTFEIDRPENKFQVGQMWAVYSDDGFPKYYVQIQSICLSPEFKLETRWLIPCRGQKTMTEWDDKKMPFGCGIFKMSRAKPIDYSLDTFSHMLDPQITGKKGEYAIFPQKGEIWALYMDWSPDMNFLDIDDFEYEVAEVLNMEKDDQTFEVLPLHHVSGHVSVFRGQESRITLTIPKKEVLRFSHRIPAFRLTDELNGTLRGYWELDPAAVPPTLLCSS